MLMGIPRAGNTTSQACAACKYQRRKCVPDCILAPFFPHDRQKQFLNAHKLFGVSKITKSIEKLNPLERQETMRSIIFQSDVRAIDPVGGCYRIIQELQRHIDYYQAELDIVLHQLAVCRDQAHQQPPMQIPDAPSVNCDIMDVVDPLTSFTHLQYQQYLQLHQNQYVDHDFYDVNTWNSVNDTASSSPFNDKNNFVEKYNYVEPIHAIPCDESDHLKFDPDDIVKRSEECAMKEEDDESIQQAHEENDLNDLASRMENGSIRSL